MDDISVQHSAREIRLAGAPPFDLIKGKLLRPWVRPGTIRRPRLIERLARSDSCPIVSVVAPAGYGKTTLLTQWPERDGQAIAWVSVDQGDNDPTVLLTYIAEALNAVEPVGQRVFDALASPANSVPGSVVPRLCSAFSSMISPVVLILDDVHLLHSSACRAALSVLADHVPAGSQLVLAGRTEPPLRIARLRAEGRLAEIGPGDLSFTVREAASLLRAAEVVLGDEDAAELHQRTEGWPVGLYLAALYLREGGSPHGAAASFGGDDRFVSEYLESELLARISSSQRAFLTRTAVLERMCGPLCEAVLGLPGSAAALTDLTRSNLLLVPLDHRGQWYRYHHLFRDMLLAELERLEPGLIPVLRHRAAAWYLQNDLPEEALEYSVLAGDADTVARLVQTLWSPVYRQGRTATLQRWFSWLEARDAIEGRPLVAMNAAFLAEKTGQPAQAERWADAVDRWQRDSGPFLDPYTEAMAATLRAISCRRGAEQMRVDADEAARKFAAANFVPVVTPLLQGTARVLCGDLDGGDAFFSAALSVEAGRGAPDILAITLCERSLAAMARNQWDHAEAFAGRAHAQLGQAGIEDCYAAALVSAVQAGAALHRGDIPAGRRELIKALRLRPLMTYAHPHWAVQLRIVLIHVDLALNDLAGARTIMREIDEILSRRPDLGTLVEEAGTLRARLSRRPQAGRAGASALTVAELRVLPLLATHLTSAEMAAELFVSVHTVKSQQASLYRKLAASSRSQAVARARQLGLLEGLPGDLSPRRGGCRRGLARGAMELSRGRQAMAPDDQVPPNGPRNRAGDGGQPGAGSLPQPLRHFADRLGEVRSAEILDMKQVGRVLVELAADAEFFGPLIAQLPSGSPGSRWLIRPERGPRLVLVHRPDGVMGYTHSHRCWVGITPVRGVETHQRWDAVRHADGRAELRLADERALAQGDAATLVPPRDVHNHGHVAGSGPSPYSLILLGDDMLLFDREEYDPERGTWRALAPGDPGRDNR